MVCFISVSRVLKRNSIDVFGDLPG